MNRACFKPNQSLPDIRPRLCSTWTVACRRSHKQVDQVGWNYKTQRETKEQIEKNRARMWRTDLLRKGKTGNKNAQLGLQHCRKTSRIMMLRVLSPTNKTLLQTLYMLPVLPAQGKLVLLQVMSIQCMAWLPRNFIQSEVRTNIIWICIS